MPALQNITDDLLVTAIKNATQRVLMIAPGVWPPVANAIASTWRRLGSGQVTVILDVDPEICRIGYGSLEGLEVLQKAATAAGEAIGQEPGVRICVFIVDDQTFVFSPTPRQLEAPPGECAVAGTAQPKANGIVLSKPPAMLENALGIGLDGISARTLGLENLNAEKLKSVTQDLQRNPAKNFDLSRAVNVYNAKIQFVELKVTGCRISENKARLPDHLLKVLENNPKLSAKIEKSIRLLDDQDELVKGPKASQETVEKCRSKIDEEFLYVVDGVGTVIERAKKVTFEKEVKGLSAEVAQFGKRVEAALGERFRETAQELSDELLTDVLADLPPKWKQQLGQPPDRERTRWRIFEDLIKAFGDPAKKVKKMTVKTVFKDVTYDMLKEADFRAQVKKYFPGLPLMEEFSAAKERSPA